MFQMLHAVLFRCVKQCSTCFCPVVCFLFEILHVQKNIFPRAFSGDLLNQKQKKPFVSPNNEVTEVWHLPLVEWLGARLF